MFRLVRALLEPLARFLQSPMGVPEPDAEELALDVLFTVARKIQTFRYGKKAKLTTWIFEIAKNRAIDFHRTTRAGALEPDGIIPGSRNAESFAGRNDGMLSWLNDELQTLAEQDRQLLLWRATEIPYTHIAGWLGITEGAARTRHTRVLAKLLKAAEHGFPKGAA